MNTFPLIKYFSFLFFVLALTGGSSCVAKKSLLDGNGSSSGNNSTVDATLSALASTEVPYTWFAGSGQGRIDWDGERYSVRYNVRIKRDSVIWMVISKLGFEVGRMLVTPDSAFFINRLEHKYSAYQTQEFLRAYNVPADFEMFSRVFTAGAYVPPGTKEVNKSDEGSIIVKGKEGVMAEHWFSADTLTKSLITDANDHEWTAGFDAYRQAETGQTFPFLRTNALLIDGKTNVFDLEYTSVQIDIPQDFPFSIPSHYEKE